MPQNTPNLNLVTYDLTTDAGVYFSTWRISLAGYTNSALTKIDTWAGQVNADLTTLKQTPSITRVPALKQSDFIYTASIPAITQYSTNSFINLSLDSDNVGVVSLDINALGGKSLLKYDSTGATVNVSAGDLRKNKNNLFTYNGTAWIWVNAISSDQLNVVGTSGNLLKISSANTVEDTGVTFGTTVTNNNIVQRTSTGQIKGATASANDDVVNKLYADTIDNKIGVLGSLTTKNKTSVVNAINELDSDVGNLTSLTTSTKTNAVGAINELDSEVGNLASLTTTSKTNLVGAVNEVDSDIATVDGKIGILSALTTTDKSNLVGAINENTSAIGQIAIDRGYIIIKTQSDFNALTNSGKYEIFNGLNAPISGGHTFLVEVIGGGSTIFQSANLVFGAVELGRSFIRYRANISNVWSNWKEIATTEIHNQTILTNGNTFPYGVGLLFHKVGNIVNVSGVVKLGTATKDSILCSNLPQNLRPTTYRGISGNQFSVNLNTPLYIDSDGAIRLGSNLSVGMDIIITGSYPL